MNERTDVHRNVDCVHVDCIGGECRYRPEPPRLGPELPRQVCDSEGGLWTRGPEVDSMVWYRRDGQGYALATWGTLRRGPRFDWDVFPAGPWTVTVHIYNDPMPRPVPVPA